jgi:hypothetical protein
MQKGLTFDEIPSFDTAALSATARAPLPVGRRSYRELLLQVEGAAAYDTGGSASDLDFRHAVEYVELFVSGKSRMLIKPPMHQVLQEHLNATDDTLPVKFLAIPLARPGYRDTDWSTGDMESMQIAVKLKSSLPTGTAVNASLTRVRGWARYEDLAVPTPLGAVFTQRVVTPNTPVAGWNTIDNLTVGALAALSKLLFFCPPTGTNTITTTAAAITQVKLSIGGRYIFNSTRDAVDADHAFSPFFALPASRWAFPCFLDYTNRFEDLPALLDGNVRQPLKVEYYWDTGVAAVAAVDILVEGLELGSPRPTVAAQ